MKKIKKYEIVFLGASHSDYFQGFGTSLTEFEESFVGVGGSINDAVEDALQNASDSWDTTEIDAQNEMDKQYVTNQHCVLQIYISPEHIEATNEIRHSSQLESSYDHDTNSLTIYNEYDIHQILNECEDHFNEPYCKNGKLDQEFKAKIKGELSGLEFNDWQYRVGLRVK